MTVVVLNWNGARLLPDCLAGLVAQDCPRGRPRPWVVDNASADRSLELLRDRFPWVRAIANPSNDGFIGGNGVALREVTTPFVALLNNDARPEPDWLGRLLEPFSELEGRSGWGQSRARSCSYPGSWPLSWPPPAFVPGTLDTRELGVRVYRVAVDGQDVTEPSAVEMGRLRAGGGGAGPLPLDPAVRAAIGPHRPEGRRPGPAAAPGRGRDDRAVMTWTGRSGGGKAEPEPVDLEVEVPAGVPLVDVLNNAGSMVFRDGYGADRAYQELDRGQYQRPEEVFAFCGSVCFRTEALRQAEVFDDDFFLYYEDTDLSWRLRSLSWRIRHQPAAVARHIHSASSKWWSPLFVFHTDRNRLLMLTKNARAGLAAREVRNTYLTTASLALREVARSRHTRRRPRSAQPAAPAGPRLLPAPAPGDAGPPPPHRRPGVGRPQTPGTLAGAAVRVE